jgi:hypothetical protein
MAPCREQHTPYARAFLEIDASLIEIHLKLHTSFTDGLSPPLRDQTNETPKLTNTSDLHINNCTQLYQHKIDMDREQQISPYKTI